MPLKRTVDYGYRTLFAALLLYAPFAALTSSRSQAAIYVLIEGLSGWVTLVGLGAIGLTIWADIACNSIPRRHHWHWISRRREFLYILGALSATTVPFSLSRYDLIESSAIWWYGWVFVSGMHLAVLDMGAKKEGVLNAAR